MIGIYKITNKLNGKIYIGQSNDIQRRFQEHCIKTGQTIEQAILKYGKENFIFEVLEECSLEELDEKEKYYIQHYNSYKEGYNNHIGGNNQSGQNNNNTKLKDEDVINIRKAYSKHSRSKEIYANYKDRISYDAFMQIWEGKTWKHIMPEVYTEENKEYYRRHTTDGELSPNAIFTNDEIIEIRKDM